MADIEADTEVRVRRLTVAADPGRVVNPAGATAQLEGAAIQAVGWTVKERLRSDTTRITSRGWDSDPILTFSEVPEVAVELVRSSDGPALAAVGPAAAALGNALPAAIGNALPAVLGNALAAALGVRLRRLPFTADHVAAHLEDAPV